MSALSQVYYSPTWNDLLERQRVGVMTRLIAKVRQAVAQRASQWAQAAIQQDAQTLRDAARSVAAYDVRLASDLQAAADRHEWMAR